MNKQELTAMLQKHGIKVVAGKVKTSDLKGVLAVQKAEAGKSLYKTTIVIWSEDSAENMTLEDIGREADSGSMYASSVKSKLIKSPEKDQDWDGTEFFESPF